MTDWPTKREESILSSLALSRSLRNSLSISLWSFLNFLLLHLAHVLKIYFFAPLFVLVLNSKLRLGPISRVSFSGNWQQTASGGENEEDLEVPVLRS